MKRNEKTTEYLRYTFTPEENTSNAKELARKNQLMVELELKKKRLAADLKSEVDAAEAEVAKLARWVNDEHDYRMIECAITFNTPRGGLKRIVRIDTGELVKEIAMTTNEMQEILPLEEPEEKPAETPSEEPPAIT